MVKRVKAKWFADKTDLPVPIGSAGLSMWKVTLLVTTIRDGWESVSRSEFYVVAGAEKDALAKMDKVILELQDGWN